MLEGGGIQGLIIARYDVLDELRDDQFTNFVVLDSVWVVSDAKNGDFFDDSEVCGENVIGRVCYVVI